MKFVILFVCCFAAGYGWTSLEMVSVDPNNPDVCISKDSVVGTMKVGEKKTVEGRCVRAICGLRVISYAGCGIVGASEGCRVLPEDLSKQYPDCCPTVVCP